MVNKKSIAKTSVSLSDGFDKDYYDWISELSQRYRQSQIKAAVRVNSEMLRFYWSVGKDISPTSLKYTKYFYCLYSPLFENRRQVADELMTTIRQQVVDKILELNRQQLVDKFFATTMPKAEGHDMPFLASMCLSAFPNTNYLSSHSPKNCRTNCLLRAKLRMA